MTAALAASLDQTSTTIGIALGVLSLLAALGGYYRWARPKYRRGKQKITGVVESLVGRDAIHDNITGVEIVPALPGIGVRMASVEQNQVETRDALRHIATLLESQQAQDHRLDNLESRVHTLEGAAAERVVAKVESIAAWDAVGKIADQRDDVDPELG